MQNTGVVSSNIEHAWDSRASERGRRVWRQRGDVARRRRFRAGREVTREMAEPFAGARRPQGATRGVAYAVAASWLFQGEGNLEKASGLFVVIEPPHKHPTARPHRGSPNVSHGLD